jgi:hypothetical protein
MKLIKKLIFLVCVNVALANNLQSKKSIEALKDSFTKKETTKFINEFPDSFNEFNDYFGWNNSSDKPSELYDNSTEYIDYWYEIISVKNDKKFEQKAINICINGKWDADAINYYQDKTLEFIKSKEKFYLINNIDSKTAKSILFFLFDSPTPVYDKEFTKGLNTEKKNILDSLFHNEFKKTTSQQDDIISKYEKNSSYFIKNFDINSDGLIDKIVSSKPYNGNELLIFINKKGKFNLDLKTINFTEDGGNIIDDISLSKGEKHTLIVKTKFPDRGLYESQFYLFKEENNWTLVKTIIRTKSNEKNSPILVCELKQNLNIKEKNFESKIKYFPENTKEKLKICREESNNNNHTFKIYDKDGYTNLRKEKNTTSSILEKVKTGETVEIIQQSGDWYLVKTKAGNQGYVYKTKIKVE